MIVAGREGERGDAPDDFGAHPQGFATGHQELNVRAPLEQRFDRGGAGVDQVLAVVQNEQPVGCSNNPAHRDQNTLARLLAHAEDHRDRRRHQVTAGQGGELDEGDFLLGTCGCGEWKVLIRQKDGTQAQADVRFYSKGDYSPTGSVKFSGLVESPP